MSRYIHRRLRLVLALLFVTALAAGRADAQGVTCQAIDSRGLPRDCTFLETLGGCFWNATDAYFQCLRSAPDDVEKSRVLWALHSTRCQVEMAVDQGMCALTSPLELALK